MAQSAQVGGDTPAKIKEAAAQFEALLIGEILKRFRESDQIEGGDQSGAPMLEMAEQQLAQVMAAHGGFGLRDIIVKGLLPKDSSSQDPGR